jgi:hypothetical protein
VVTPEQWRTVVEHALESARLSECEACRSTGFARSSQRCQSRKDDVALGARHRTLAILRPRWGYQRLYRLLRREPHDRRVGSDCSGTRLTTRDCLR